MMAECEEGTKLPKESGCGSSDVRRLLWEVYLIIWVVFPTSDVCFVLSRFTRRL